MPRPNGTAYEAYRALTIALADSDAPPCTDDPRFILEPSQIAAQEVEHIGLTICRVCPLHALCRAYGDAARPTAGIWAGRTYKPRQRRTRKEEQ